MPEAKALGIYELLRNTCGLEVRWWDIYLGSQLMMYRDFLTTTPHQSPLFGFYHPAMQEVLLTAAAEAGAEVWRGASVRAVRSGALPTVTVEQDGWMSELQARLVVAADGRSSLTRQWAGFEVQQDPERRLFAGVLLENVPLAPDTWYAVLNPANGQEVFLGNVGRSWVRAYLGYPKDAHRRFQTTTDVPRLIEESLRTGAAADLYAHARAVGPLATFGSDDSWVEHPYKEGVALIGDAAATCDPSFGQGLAVTLRGVRLLRDQLLKTEDWENAGHAYAEEQHRNFWVIHTLEDWFRSMFLETGPEADARRARALPLLVQDGSRMPDLFGMGPDAPITDTIKRRFFGEE
ncbi:MAG TPA: FAD-dependent monooxygenase [Candidatus Binatia bacterium]|nr:FAD-dependent monooxygenase [Candidatus Binatia bacterium]